MSRLVADMRRVRGVQDVHDLHVWSITSGMYALSCHVLIDDLPPSGSSPILQSLTIMLRDQYRIDHSTIQFECSAQGACCETDDLYCCIGGVKEQCCEHESTPLNIENKKLTLRHEGVR